MAESSLSSSSSSSLASSSAGALSSVAMPVLLDATERAIAAALVARVVTAERRRQRWWWWSLVVLMVVGVRLATGDEPDVGDWWNLGIIFVGNMLFHVVTGLVTRARLGVDASREVLDVSGLMHAVTRVRTGKRAVDLVDGGADSVAASVAAAIDHVDRARGLRAR